MALKPPAKGCAGRAGNPGSDEPFSTFRVINTEWRWLQPTRTGAVKIDGSYERAAKGLGASAAVESDIAGILATCKTKGWVAVFRIDSGGGNLGGVNSTSGAADIAGTAFSGHVPIAAAGAPGWVKDAGLGGKARMTSWDQTQRQEEFPPGGNGATLTTKPPIEFTQYEIPCYWTTQYSDAYDYLHAVLASTGTVTGSGFMAGVSQSGFGLDTNAQVAIVGMTAGGYQFPEPMLHHAGGIEHHNPSGDLTSKGHKTTAIPWWPPDTPNGGDTDNHNGREIYRALQDTGWDFAQAQEALWLAEWASTDPAHPPAFPRFLATHAKYWVNTHTSMSYNPYDTVTRGTFSYPSSGIVGNPTGSNSRAFEIMDYFAGDTSVVTPNSGLHGRAEIMTTNGGGNSFGNTLYSHVAALGAPVGIQTQTYPACLNGAAGTTDAAKWQNVLNGLVGGGASGYKFTRIELPGGYQAADPAPHPITAAADAQAKANPLVRTDPGTGSTGDVTDSLIFKYSMEDLQTATTLVDDSGNGNDATLVNFPYPLPKVASSTGNGQALLFDRPSLRYAVLPARNALNSVNTSGYTMSGWMYIAETATTQANWEVMEQFGAKWMNVRADTKKLRFAMQTDAAAGNTTRYQCDSASAVPQNQWVHVAGVYDPSTTPATQRVYINGVLDHSQTSDPTNGAIPRTGPYASSNPMVIGAHFGGAGAAPSVTAPLENWMHGPMDGVRLYSRALSGAEIAAVYAATTAVAAGPNIASYSQATWLDPAYTADFGAATNVASATQIVGATGFTQNALRVQATAAGTMTWKLAPIPVASLIGQNLSGSVLVQQDTSGGVARSATLTFTFRDSGTATIGSPTVSTAVNTPAASASPKKLTITSVTVPTGAVDVVVSVSYASAAVAGEAQRLGDVAVRPGDDPSFVLPHGVPPVTNLNVTAASTSADLSWAPPPGANSIVIRRIAGSTAPTWTTGTVVSTLAGSAVAGTDSGLTTNTQYSWTVFAVDATGVPSIAASGTATAVSQQTQQVSRLLLTVTVYGVTAVPGTVPPPPPSPSFTLVTLQDQITDAGGTPVRSAQILISVVPPDGVSAVYAPGHRSIVQPAQVDIGPNDGGIWSVQLYPDSALSPPGSYSTVLRSVPGGFRDPTPVRVRIDGTDPSVWLNDVIVLPSDPYIFPDGTRVWLRPDPPPQDRVREGDQWINTSGG